MQHPRVYWVICETICVEFLIILSVHFRFWYSNNLNLFDEYCLIVHFRFRNFASLVVLCISFLCAFLKCLVDISYVCVCMFFVCIKTKLLFKKYENHKILTLATGDGTLISLCLSGWNSIFDGFVVGILLVNRLI